MMKRAFRNLFCGAAFAPLALVLLALCVVTGLTACTALTRSGSSQEKARMTAAVYTKEPVTIDGRLDEAVWSRAKSYSYVVPADRTDGARGVPPTEAGRVRYAWDDTHFYAAFEFTDRDIVQESDEDQQHHYKTGDVAELFLKPQNATHYWELYVTPNGKKTAFFFPGRGRLGLASNYEYKSDLRVASHVRGTLNDWRDDDEGWTAEVAIPRAELAAAGVPLDPQHPWTVLAARYNFGRHLPTSGAELSTFPGLSRTSFHLYEEYAPLQLID